VIHDEFFPSQIKWLLVVHVEAFGDSLLVVHQVSKVYQCYNGALNAYLDKCLDIISCFDEFVIRHIPREDEG